MHFVYVFPTSGQQTDELWRIWRTLLNPWWAQRGLSPLLLPLLPCPILTMLATCSFALSLLDSTCSVQRNNTTAKSSWTTVFGFRTPRTLHGAQTWASLLKRELAHSCMATNKSALVVPGSRDCFLGSQECRCAFAFYYWADAGVTKAWLCLSHN